MHIYFNIDTVLECRPWFKGVYPNVGYEALVLVGVKEKTVKEESDGQRKRKKRKEKGNTSLYQFKSLGCCCFRGQFLSNLTEQCYFQGQAPRG